MLKTIEMDLTFSPYIAIPPQSPKELYQRACSNDEITMNTWREIWIKHVKLNREKFGPFKDKGVGRFFNRYHQRPVIVAGSGPSLKNNVDLLKDTKGIALISCLHNYQFFEDRGITPDFYTTLDAGYVTVDEVSEGGTKTPDEYFESTKNKKLLAFIGSHPELLAKWQGEIYFFHCPIPDASVSKTIEEIDPFHTYVSTGGNVLGASFYIAKAIMGANPVVFVGSDFAFSYTKKFHAWDSKYDANLGNVLRATDIFGNKVYTWASYYNFKCWFESRILSTPGIYINATEGGIFGAYPDGNIEHLRQMALYDVIRMYSLSDEVKDQCLDPSIADRKILF